MSGNVSNCFDDYCVESTLYRKIMGTIIFVMVWPFIVLDIKVFPIGRPAAALLGAVLMVVFVVVPQKQVYVVLGERGNLQTLFLLVGMMLLCYYYDREGMLQYITLWIFGKNKPFKHVLWKVCVLSAVLSAVITNDATCMVLTPLLLTEHMKQKRPEIEFPPLLLGIATSANIGSAATFFGNPQNAFIAANSRGEVSLLIFFITNLPAAIVGMFISVVLLYFCYYRTIWPKKRLVVNEANRDGWSNGMPPTIISMAETTNMEEGEPLERRRRLGGEGGQVYHEETVSLAASRVELALSYDRSPNPLASSLVSQERSKMYANNIDSSGTYRNGFGSKSAQGVCASITETSYSGPASSPEYGATHDYANHLYNHVQSGQESQFPNIGNSNRFGSSMRISESCLLRDEVEEEEEERKSVGNGDLHSADHQTDATKETQDTRASTWRRKAFIIWLVIITCILVILLAIPPPPAIPVEFNLGLVPVGAGVITMLVDTLLNRKYGYDAIMKVDWAMILMFMGLFIWLCGFENTLFPRDAFNFIMKYMDLHTVHGVLIFTLFVVIGSNILSNVPLVILVINQLFNFQCGHGNYCSGQLIGTLLAWTSTVAGNFTLIGSVANLIVAEKGRNITNYRLGFWEYLKFGFFSTILVLFAGLPIVYFAGDRVDI